MDLIDGKWSSVVVACLVGGLSLSANLASAQSDPYYYVGLGTQCRGYYTTGQSTYFVNPLEAGELEVNVGTNQTGSQQAYRAICPAPLVERQANSWSTAYGFATASISTAYELSAYLINIDPMTMSYVEGPWVDFTGYNDQEYLGSIPTWGGMIAVGWYVGVPENYRALVYLQSYQVTLHN